LEKVHNKDQNNSKWNNLKSRHFGLNSTRLN
jgi:hypothetical protein